ncbi:MAG TPA: hypothetical protein VN786_00380 [Acidimicrobiales bacterium]|nr:hypothetical protein [Acidimicrobiales bacterium]
MVATEEPLLIGEVLLEHRDGSVRVSGIHVGGGDVVAGGEGVGMVAAQDSFQFGETLLEQRNRPARVLRFLVGAGEVVAGGHDIGVVVPPE